jgi:glycosyltransferase involved in cell wall biosynthesis
MTTRTTRRLLVICPYPEHVAPSQRLKYEQYFASWERAGCLVTVSPFITPAFMRIVYGKGHTVARVLWTLLGYLRRVGDLFRLPLYDAVYIHLWVVPFGPPLFERLYCALSKAVVYDIDDPIHTRVRQKVNANWFTYWLKSASRITCLMKRSDHVIVSCAPLEEFARNFNPRVTVIPPTVDTDAFVSVNNYTNHRPLVLGWTGSHSTSRWLPLVRNALLELRRELDFRLLLIGDPTFRLEGLEDIMTSLPWVEATEVSDLRPVDIGLYPLPDDDPWVLGKSALKAITYMAMWIPTLASGVGANCRVVEDGVSGFLVHTPEEWKAAIRRLAADPELRRRMGQKGRERVERLYPLRANSPAYLAVLDKVTGMTGKVVPGRPKFDRDANAATNLKASPPDSADVARTPQD